MRSKHSSIMQNSIMKQVEQPLQQRIQHSIISKDCNPSKNADKGVGKERYYNQNKQSSLMLTACHCITTRQGNKNSNSCRNYRNPQSSPDNQSVGFCKHLRICLHAEFHKDSAIYIALHERIGNDYKERSYKKQREPQSHRPCVQRAWVCLLEFRSVFCHLLMSSTCIQCPSTEFQGHHQDNWYAA